MIISKRVALAIGGVAAAAVVGTAGIAAAAGSSGGGAPQQLAVATTPAGSPNASASPDGTPSPDGTAKDRRARHPRLARLARGIHGEFVAKGKDGKFVTIVTVRGTVTAVSPTSVTFKAEDGYTATFLVGSESKVRGRNVDTIGDVKVGDSGAAVGVKGADGITARTVLVRAK